MTSFVIALSLTGCKFCLYSFDKINHNLGQNYTLHVLCSAQSYWLRKCFHPAPDQASVLPRFLRLSFGICLPKVSHRLSRVVTRQGEPGVKLVSIYAFSFWRRHYVPTLLKKRHLCVKAVFVIFTCSAAGWDLTRCKSLFQGSQGPESLRQGLGCHRAGDSTTHGGGQRNCSLSLLQERHRNFWYKAWPGSASALPEPPHFGTRPPQFCMLLGKAACSLREEVGFKSLIFKNSFWAGLTLVSPSSFVPRH